MAEAGGPAVAVLYGGPSVEHDVSIISALQLMEALDGRHRPVPVYLARDGRWWTGEALRSVEAYGEDDPAGAEPLELSLGGHEATFSKPGRRGRRHALDVDVAICAVHGSGGEDGALLGALEHAGVAYAGGGVGPAAAAMDKALAKLVFASAGIEVNPHTLLTREEFAADPRAAAARAADEQGLPVYAKPLSLGSSIGVARCTTADELEEALELCFELDRRALVEPALDEAIEINVAVLGRPGGELRASVCEQPLREEGEVLSFEDKYLRGGKGGKGKGGANGGAPGSSKAGDDGGMAGQERLIPAPIAPELARRISDTALKAHAALGFAGVVRYDFLVGGDGADAPIVLNEANTVPGSFAFYLFEPDGLPFAELAGELVRIALAEQAELRSTTRTFESVLISNHRSRA